MDMQHHSQMNICFMARVQNWMLGLISGDFALGRCSRMGVKLTATAVMVVAKAGHNTRNRGRLRK